MPRLGAASRQYRCISGGHRDDVANGLHATGEGEEFWHLSLFTSPLQAPDMYSITSRVFAGTE
jgi:hypothetical protein